MIADMIGGLAVGVLICSLIYMFYFSGYKQRNDLYDRLLGALGPDNIRRYDSCWEWAIAVRRKGDRVRLVWAHCDDKAHYTGDLVSQDLDWVHLEKKYTVAEFVVMVKEELAK